MQDLDRTGGNSIEDQVVTVDPSPDAVTPAVLDERIGTRSTTDVEASFAEFLDEAERAHRIVAGNPVGNGHKIENRRSRELDFQAFDFAILRYFAFNCAKTCVAGTVSPALAAARPRSKAESRAAKRFSRSSRRRKPSRKTSLFEL
jgi:hypothetical protein